jgi:hypothetical protein
MSNTRKKQPENPAFREPISTYSRAQAIEEGVLVDGGPTAREAGFRMPVALTAAVWADCVAWSEKDSRKQVHQDQSGRLCYETREVSLS